jgi:hypothetical protein
MLGHRAVFCVTLAAAWLFVVPVARADDKTELAAESAFAEGTRLMKADRCNEAVAKFRESQRLDPASGTALNIGYCEAKLGRIASAWLAYRQAHRLAQSQGKTQHEALAREQADKLEPEVPHIVVSFDRNAPPDASLRLDGAPLERDMWSVPIPLDPGEHKIERISADAEPWAKSITLARGERLTIDVPALAGVEPPPVAAPVVSSEAAHETPPPRRDDTRGGTSAQRTWGFVVGGAGVAAFATGTALLVSARLKYDGAEDDCPPVGCNDDGFETRESARTQAFVGMGVGAAGIVLTGVGLGLVLLADDGPGEQSAFVVGSPETPFALGFRSTY